MTKDIIENGLGVGIFDEQPVFKIFDTETGLKALLIVDDDAAEDARFTVLHFKDPEMGEIDCLHTSERGLVGLFGIEQRQVNFLLSAK